MKTHTKNPFLKIVFVLILIFLFFYLPQRQTQSSTQTREEKNQVLGIEEQTERQGAPLRLRIPSINVDTLIEHVGITANGEMEVASNSVNVGWFSFGPRPGERGSAVIAGHFDGKNDEAGVFTNLNKLKAGNNLYIEDEKGISKKFTVRGSRIYNPGYADDVFSPSDSSSHLNLVTCDGVWDGAEKSYSKRLVVFTDLEL